MSLGWFVKGAAGVLAGAGLGLLAVLSLRFIRGRARADRVWTGAGVSRLVGMGTVPRLRITPLIDWFADSSKFATEPGVAYLVEAGDKRILFDLGYNMLAEHPSPILRNMQALGASPDGIDMVFISHAHGDHVGGMAHQMKGTFGLSGEPVDLRGVAAFVPQPMSNPTARVMVVNEPMIVAPGVASIGPIPRQMFFLGWTLEQSLAVNVAGKGIVLIVGCGHPTLQRIVQRAEVLFDAPIHGVVGGMHFPVTASREALWGLPAQRILGTGKWPWDPINEADVFSAIGFLRARKPGLVSISPHDSCDWSLSAFRNAFGDAYQPLLVGRSIVVE